jgi:hypothetical protein
MEVLLPEAGMNQKNETRFRLQSTPAELPQRARWSTTQTRPDQTRIIFFSVLRLGIWVQLPGGGMKPLFNVIKKQAGFTPFAEMTLGKWIKHQSATRGVLYSRYGLVLPAFEKNARQGQHAFNPSIVTMETIPLS